MRGAISEGVVMESKNGPENGCGILQVVSCRPVGGCILTDYGRCQRGALFQVALNVLSSCCHIGHAGPIPRPIGPFTRFRPLMILCEP